MKIPYIYFDIRTIYQKYNVISNYSIYRMIEDNINKLIKSKPWTKIKNYLSKISEIQISGLKININLDNINKSFPLLYKLFDTINEWANDINKNIIIVFDEAQYLRYSKLNFRGLLAYIYDNLKNITLILSGSEVGLLHDFLKINDPNSELYGRYYYEITLKRLSKTQSKNFLKKDSKNTTSNQKKPS